MSRHELISKEKISLIQGNKKRLSDEYYDDHTAEHKEEEKQEAPTKLMEALEILRTLHLLVSVEHPNFTN